MASTPAISTVTVAGAWATVTFSDTDWSSYQSYVVTLQSASVPELQWQFPPVTPAAGQMVAQMSLASLSPAFDPTQTYNVTVAGSPGGPASSPYTLPNSSPAVSAMGVTPWQLTVTWSDVYPPVGLDHYTATLWKAGGAASNFPDVPAGLPMTASMQPPMGGLDPAGVYTVNVTGYGTSGPLLTSASVDVVAALASGTVALASDLMTLSISVPLPPVPASLNAFAFRLLDGDTPIASTSAVAPAPVMTWTLGSPLQAGRRYSITVAAQVVVTTGGGSLSQGPFGPSTPVIVGVPAVLGTPAFDGKVLTAAWTRVLDPAVIGYLVQVSGADTLSFVTGVETALSVPAAISGTDLLTVAAISAASTGPSSSAVSIQLPTAPAAPSLNVASYDGTMLFLDWTPVGGATGYVANVTDGTAALSYWTGSETTLSVPVGLDFTKTWTAQVTATSAAGSGAPSDSRDVTARAIAGAPVVKSVSYDGEQLAVSWTAVLDTTVLGYRVVVSGGVLDQVVVGTSLVVPAALDPTGSYTVEVRAVSAVSAGPASAAATVVPVAPELTAVQYASGTISVTWTLAAVPDGATFELALLDGLSQIASTTDGVTATGGTLAAELAPGRSYTVRGRVLVNGNTGPWSGLGGIINSVPTITSTSYDGTGVTATWGALADPSVEGYLATLSEVGGSAIGSPVATGGNSAVIPASGVTADKSYQVTVQAIGHAAVGPASAPLAAVIETVALTGVVYDSGVLQLTWGAAATSDASYLVEVLENGSVIASQASTQPAASLAIALSGGAAYSARVRVVSGAALGAPGEAIPVLAATTFVTQGTTDPITGLTRFTWAALSGADSYFLQAYLGGLPSGAPLPVTGTQYTFPTALVRNSDFAVAVAGVSSSGSVPVNGPYGPRFFPPTIQPVVLAASYNGVTASISWDLVDGATGYRVSVLQSGASTPVGVLNVNAVTHTAVFAPSVTDPTKSYGTVVQAMVGTNLGPPSAQQPIFSPGFFLSTQPAATYAPFIYPALNLALVRSSKLGQTGATAQIYLPNLAGAGTLQLPFTQGPFQMTANTSPTTRATFPAILTIPGNSSAWAFGPSDIRASLQQDYVAFLKQAEEQGAVPAGISLLQQVISRYMPQTFAETLYYAFGLTSGSGAWVDLRPGMVLRVAFGEHLEVPDSQIATWMDGYVGGAVVDYDVGSYLSSGGSWLQGLDAFIARLVASGAMEVSEPQVTGTNETGLADSADLFFSDFNAPFYRLFFPGELQTPSGPGSPVPASNFALAAAASYTALDQATNVPSDTNPVAYFRGRAVVRVCLRVTVHGVERVVPVGTTVRNLLEQLGHSPPSTSVGLDGMVLERSLGPVVLNSGVRFSVGQSYRVRLDWDTMPVYAPGLDALSLSLMPGDKLIVGA